MNSDHQVLQELNEGYIRSVRTSLVVFDTAVADLTDQLSDPVEALFGAAGTFVGISGVFWAVGLIVGGGARLAMQLRADRTP